MGEQPRPIVLCPGCRTVMKAIGAQVVTASSFEVVTYRCATCETETPRVMQQQVPKAPPVFSGNIQNDGCKVKTWLPNLTCRSPLRSRKLMSTDNRGAQQK
jgi:hypothetical protein